MAHQPAPPAAVSDGKLSRRNRVLLAPGLFLLSPLTAEYLLGYDSTTGKPLQLLGGLLVLAPLYGGPALLIRETARRIGGGWPAMLLLAGAFGICQSGLVDHSLFNTSYRDIPYWDAMLRPTYMPVIGVSAYLALTFVIGHMVWSIGVPIALAESFASGGRQQPWLNRIALAAVAILYVAASSLVLLDHLEMENFLPSATQLAATAGLVVALVAAGVLIARPPSTVSRPVVRPVLLVILSLVVFSLPGVLDGISFMLQLPSGSAYGWPATSFLAATYALLALVTVHVSQSAEFSPLHRLAVAAGALLANTWQAFLVQPIGDVTALEKYTHNLVFAMGALLVIVLAARSITSRPGKDSADAPIAETARW